MDVDRNILRLLDFPQGQVIKSQSRPGGYEGRKESKMEVCIVNTIARLKYGKGWQIMKRAGTGYNHVFPGALYTVEEATNICNEHNFHVVAIGDFWECLKK